MQSLEQSRAACFFFSCFSMLRFLFTFFFKAQGPQLSSLVLIVQKHFTPAKTRTTLALSCDQVSVFLGLH